MGFLTVALIVLGVIVYKQKQEFALFKQGGNVATTNFNVAVNTPDLVKINEASKQAFLGDEKTIIGEVKSIEGNSFFVESSVADTVQVEKIDFSKPYTIKQIKKTYQIQIAPTTIFSGKKLSELIVGDMVQVYSSDPVLTVTKFLAEKVLFIDVAIH